MKALVVYESMWGNTEQVAKAVAEGLGRRVEVVVGEVSQVSPEAADDVDLLVIGGPTHAFSMSRGTTRTDAVTKGATQGTPQRGEREWLEALGEHGPDMATFDTRVEKVRHLPGSAAKAAAKAARRSGHRLAAKPESFYVLDMAGPLLDGELDRARAWGEGLVAAAHDELLVPC